MNILILADKKNKTMLQQILDWGKFQDVIKFQMTFTTDKKKIDDIIKYGKYDFIISSTELMSKHLQESGKRFIKMNKSWERGMIHV